MSSRYHLIDVAEATDESIGRVRDGLDEALAVFIPVEAQNERLRCDAGIWRRYDIHAGILASVRLRANPLLRVKVKFTVKNAVCCRRRLSYTTFLTVILALTRTSGAALT